MGHERGGSYNCGAISGAGGGCELKRWRALEHLSSAMRAQPARSRARSIVPKHRHCFREVVGAQRGIERLHLRSRFEQQRVGDTQTQIDA